MRKYHVPFWRAVEEATPSLTLIILFLALQARGGHPQSNAVGVGASTLLGGTLVEQVLTLSTESPAL
jgi:hypothetical protein